MVPGWYEPGKVSNPAACGWAVEHGTGHTGREQIRVRLVRAGHRAPMVGMPNVELEKVTTPSTTCMYMHMGVPGNVRQTKQARQTLTWPVPKGGALTIRCCRTAAEQKLKRVTAGRLLHVGQSHTTDRPASHGIGMLLLFLEHHHLPHVDGGFSNATLPVRVRAGLTSSMNNGQVGAVRAYTASDALH